MRLMIGLALLGALLACGCQNAEAPRSTSFVIDNASPDEVFAVAERLLGDEFPGLERDPQRRALTTEDDLFSATRDTGSARDLVGGESEMRRRAFFAVEERNGSTVAKLRVESQRRDTFRQGPPAPTSGRLSDLPSDTPGDYELATTQSQREIWSPPRRDHGLERRLLTAIRDSFASAPRRDAEERSIELDDLPLE